MVNVQGGILGWIQMGMIDLPASQEGERSVQLAQSKLGTPGEAEAVNMNETLSVTV